MAACSAQPGLDGFDSGEVAVGDTVLSVAVASTSSQRGQGLSGLDEMPRGLDGMLFIWDAPSTTTFHMSGVGFPLDVWFFDGEGMLIGSTSMSTCPDGACTSYSTPGPVMWALETPAGDFSFAPGSRLNIEG